MNSMDAPPHVGLRAFIAAFALIGLTGVAPVSLAELSVGGACPHLGPVPACHLVTAAYAAVLLTALQRRLWNPIVFMVAWLPIFALAATGSGLELMGHETCPKTSGGIPKCYFSLGLAIALYAPFLIHMMRPIPSTAPSPH